MNEIWRPIEDDSNYMVSNLGNIISIKTNRILKGYVDRKGYCRYDLSINGERVVKYGHRLVAEAFLPKIEGKNSINHKDGDKTNNNVDNLEWCSPQENSIHTFTVLNKKQSNEKAVKCLETGLYTNPDMKRKDARGFQIV